MNGPDWYCPHCDKAVAHADTRNGHHDEAKGGCGRSAYKFGWVKHKADCHCEACHYANHY